jgi:Ca2+-binding EF-hand superfamily protein
MTGNNCDGHTNTFADPGGDMQKNLDLIWIKLDERFSGIAESFRFFDKNYNNMVHFSEFLHALDNLRIKFRIDIAE